MATTSSRRRKPTDQAKAPEDHQGGQPRLRRLARLRLAFGNGAIPRFEATATSDEVAVALREQGVAIVERLASPELCDQVEAELEPHIAATPPGGDEFTGVHTRRTGALLARTPSSVDMVAHPLVLDVADRVLWEKKTTFQLHLTQAITIGPGAAQDFTRTSGARLLRSPTTCRSR